jgi:hypothetical protein
MAVNRYVQGALVRVRGSFADSTGAAVDPNAVGLAYDVAGGAETVLAYPAAIVKDSTGNYHYDIDTTPAPGAYKYRWYSTGSGQASNRGLFFVDPSALG